MGKRGLFLMITIIVLIVGCSDKLTNFDNSKVEISIASIVKSDFESEIYTFKIKNQTGVDLDALALYLRFTSKVGGDMQNDNELSGYGLVGTIENSSILEELSSGKSAEFQVRIPRIKGYLDTFGIDLDNPKLVLNGFVGKEDFSISINLDELVVDAPIK